MTLKDIAYTSIKKSILTCKYAPGQSLNEDFLCNDLKISRTPIREALSRLNQENLIKIIPKKGIMIASIKFSDLNYLYDARLFMEPNIIKEFGKNADKEKLLSFLYSISSLEMDKVNTLEYTEQDMNFHAYIFDLPSNPYFTNFYSNISNMDYRLSVLGGEAPITRRKKSKEEHIAIIKAMIAEKYSDAAKIMEEHIQAARQSKFELLMSDTKFASYFAIR